MGFNFSLNGPSWALITSIIAGPFFNDLYVFLACFIIGRRSCFAPILIVLAPIWLKFDALFDRGHVPSIQRLDLKFGQFELFW